MAIPQYTGLAATLGTSVGTDSTTWTLMFRYGSFCTQFVHDGSSQNFTGKALLRGHALNVGDGFTVSIGTAPPLTMTVVSAIYTTTLGTTAPYFLASFSNVPNPYSTYTPYHATLSGSFAAQTIALVGETCVHGEIYGTIVSGSDELVNNGNVFINISRGGSCPV